MTDNFSLDDYSDLAQTGHSSFEQIAPEDEFFHSIYISGITRDNESGKKEEAGNLQVRGVQYNLQEINMVIIHVKDVNVKAIQTEQGKRESLVCFSYKEGPTPQGTTKLEDGSLRFCPANATERATDDFCSPCRNHLLVAGVYCNPEGTPILTEDNKPIFVFIRGRGLKYKNVSDYLAELYKEELDPLFTPATDQSREFEKAVVNNKRFVTKITIGEVGSRYGPKKVFVLNRGNKLEDDFVRDILQVSKKTLKKFIEKFDWSKTIAKAAPQASGYTQEADGVLKIDGEDKPQEAQPETKPEEPQSKSFSFEDVNFD